jgi:hypothetical protein
MHRFLPGQAQPGLFSHGLLDILSALHLADSPWPMYRQNSRHTGRTERPALNNAQKRSDANFQFQIYTDLGRTNTTQTSPDLTTWTPLTNILITNIPMEFIDWDANNFARRFYSAVQQ